jgi:(R,R)-butanediol dehydrogenase/meso-butanediol dehydrogenase/diacetyl reductase
MEALVWEGAGVVEAADVERPAVGDGMAIIDVAYSGICGTDLHIVAGEHPRAQPGLVLGHEFAGRLRHDVDGLAAGTPVTVEPLLWCGRCRACRAGRRHVCDRLRMIGIDTPGGLAEQVAVPAELLIALPEALSLRDAAFIEPLAVAVRAVRRSRLQVGETALVVGAGPIGLTVALVARLSGAREVVVAEPSPLRRALAEELGFTLVDADAWTEARTVPLSVVFDTAAAPPVAARLTRWADAGERVVVVGVYADAVPVDLRSVTFRELEVIGTRVYTRADLETAAVVLSDGRFDAGPLITSVLPLADGPGAFDRLRGGEEVKVLLEVAP